MAWHTNQGAAHLTFLGTARPWATERPQSATFVELFFDLVFVFAVTSITQILLHDIGWGGLGHGVLILWLVWWAWTQFTWTLNPADTDHPGVRLITLAATAAAFFMATAIPDAFTKSGGWFAISYALVRLLGLGLQLGVTSAVHKNLRAVAAWMAGSGLGILLVVVGGFSPSPLREALWAGAILVDILSAGLAAQGEWKLHASHFAERHGLIVIIALGESLIAAGVALAHLPRDAAFAVGTIVTVIAICALWWVYFVHVKDDLEEHLASSPPRDVGREARNIYSWGHLPIIAGIISMAVAIEHILTHPAEQGGTNVLVALAAGVLLFLGGIAYGLRRLPQRRILPWGVAAAVTVVAVTATNGSHGIFSLSAVAAILVGLAVWETMSANKPAGHPA